MEIRVFNENDIEAVMDVFYHSVHAIAGNVYSQKQRDAWASPDERSEKTKSFLTFLIKNHAYVAIKDAKVIGFLDMQDDGYLNCLYVAPAYQKHGIAQQLFNTLQNLAKTLSLSKLTVDASEIAKPFFEKNGFTTVKKQTVIRHNVELTNYKMEKVI